MTRQKRRIIDRHQLRQAREDAGYSLTDLAQATALSRGALHRLESGSRTRPHPRTYLRIIRCLRLREGDLWVYPEQIGAE